MRYIYQQIRASDVNFWKMGFDAMQLQYDNKTYPPRVKMTIMLKNSRDQFKLPIKFMGCTSNSLLDIDLALPLTGNLLTIVCIMNQVI